MSQSFVNSSSPVRPTFVVNFDIASVICQTTANIDDLKIFPISVLCDGKKDCFENPAMDDETFPYCCEWHEVKKFTTCSFFNIIAQKCVNKCGPHGVCLMDGGRSLCYCNDGFSGKKCEVSGKFCELQRNLMTCLNYMEFRHKWVCEETLPLAGPLHKYIRFILLHMFARVWRRWSKLHRCLSNELFIYCTTGNERENMFSDVMIDFRIVYLIFIVDSTVHIICHYICRLILLRKIQFAFYCDKFRYWRMFKSVYRTPLPGQCKMLQHSWKLFLQLHRRFCTKRFTAYRLRWYEKSFIIPRTNRSQGLLTQCFRYDLDIDECAEGVAHCEGNTTCVNTIGSFQCVSQNCQTGFQELNGECVGKSPAVKI